jgi:hypothetical protein
VGLPGAGQGLALQCGLSELATLFQGRGVRFIKKTKDLMEELAFTRTRPRAALSGSPPPNR